VFVRVRVRAYVCERASTRESLCVFVCLCVCLYVYRVNMYFLHTDSLVLNGMPNCRERGRGIAENSTMFRQSILTCYWNKTCVVVVVCVCVCVRVCVCVCDLGEGADRSASSLAHLRYGYAYTHARLNQRAAASVRESAYGLI